MTIGKATDRTKTGNDVRLDKRMRILGVERVCALIGQGARPAGSDVKNGEYPVQSEPNVSDTLKEAAALRSHANDQRGEVAALVARFSALAARNAHRAPAEAPLPS